MDKKDIRHSFHCRMGVINVRKVTNSSGKAKIDPSRVDAGGLPKAFLRQACLMGYEISTFTGGPRKSTRIGNNKWALI